MTACAYETLIPAIYRQIQSPGLLLGCGPEGNPMTIGWGAVGFMWRKPVFSLMVRHSRYSHDLLEELPQFIINIPEEGEFKKEIAICGAKSGREMDKNAQCGFQTAPGETVSVPYITNFRAHIECRIIHKTELQPDTMPPELIETLYPKRNIHTFYHGEITGCFLHNG